VAIAVMTGLATRDLEVSAMSAFWPLHASWGLRLVPFAAVCPAGFMVATAKWRRLGGNIIVCTLILCIVTAIPAIAKIHTANVPGVITDPGGGRVVNAAVTAINRNTNAQYRATSDKWGTFTFTLLPVGAYDFTVDAEGFKKAVRKNIELWVGGTGEVDFSLETSEGSHLESDRSRCAAAERNP
jgi:hypothetical protein